LQGIIDLIGEVDGHHWGHAHFIIQDYTHGDQISFAFSIFDW